MTGSRLRQLIARSREVRMRETVFVIASSLVALWFDIMGYANLSPALDRVEGGIWGA